jgi:hypothetical protein
LQREGLVKENREGFLYYETAKENKKILPLLQEEYRTKSKTS